MTQSFRHPLAVLRHTLGLGAVPYLKRIAARHQALGHGTMATRREKLSRWENGVAVPELTAQLAIADLHRIPVEAVHTHPWPDWLLLALNDRLIADLPWTHPDMLRVLADTARGGPMDRRSFLIVTGTTLTAAADNWHAALGHATPTTTSGRLSITNEIVEHLEQRLDHLRRLDDTLGSGTLRAAAAEELRLTTRLLDSARYTSAIGQRLHSTVAESARLCGWLAFDSGYHSAAQRYYLTALRAAAVADDRATGANILAFLAIQTYSKGNPADAISLVDTAQTALGRDGTPRLRAMLHARLARAFAKAGHAKDTARALHSAHHAHDQGPHDDDPAWSYWFTTGELANLAGSCAMDLGNPTQALHHFEASLEAARERDQHHRDLGLRLTRTAQAHLANGDIEQACAIAQQALARLTDITSARSANTLDAFRSKLKPHHDTSYAREFLAALHS